ASGMPSGVTFTGSTRTFSGTPASAGTFAVTVTASDNGTPVLIATNTFHIVINAALLTIGANPQTKSYGATDPLLTFTANGFQFTDTPASVLSGTLTRAPGETVAGGPYAITQGSLVANGNYTVVFTGSALTITPAPLGIVAQSKTKTYGAADPPLNFT